MRSFRSSGIDRLAVRPRYAVPCLGMDPRFREDDGFTANYRSIIPRKPLARCVRRAIASPSTAGAGVNRVNSRLARVMPV
jgi:hypothetical protein